jgi:hypothetical protein
MIRIHDLLLTLRDSQTVCDTLTDAPPITLRAVGPSPERRSPRHRLIETTREYVLRFCARAGTASKSDTRSGNLDLGFL